MSLTYIVPLEEVDQHMAAHVRFLKKYHRRNIFVASGRKVPGEGGIILAVAASQEEIEKIISEDPFHKLRLAEFEITRFSTSLYHQDLKDLVKGKPMQ